MHLLLLLACSPSSPLDPAPDPVYWAGEDLRPALDHSFFTEHDLGELSLYAHCEEGPEEERPDAAHRGALGVGNGATFSLLGLAAPLNRLHSMTGPTYEKGTRFFGDHWFTLEVDGAEVTFDRECIARPRGTSLVLTRADAGDVSLYTVDFAPRLSDADAPPVLLRHLLLATDSAHDLRLVHHAWQDLETLDGAVVERVGEERLLSVRVLEGSASLDPGLIIDLGTVQGEARAQVAFETALSDDALATLEAQVDAADRGAWLDQTLSWWRDKAARGVQLHSEDPRVEDLYDALRTTVLVQTNLGGGIAPMSRYTGVWLRDTIGPVRFLLRAGLHEDARAALDYLHACHVDSGDYDNSCTSGLDPSSVGPDPDWASMGEMSGRTAAEGPSYVPLAWLDHAAWTADDTFLEARWDYLVRGLRGQPMDEEGRQTFSGDETFRLLMNVAVGLPLEYPWEELAWSANTSLLMKAAASRMSDAATTLGKDDDAAMLAARAERADHALRTHFLQDGGWLAPYIFHSAGDENDAGEVATAPFEDVNLQVLWSGALAVDDPLALSDLRALQAVAGRDDGTVQSPAHATYAGEDLYGVTIEDGVCTGMVPGYYLSTLTTIGDPQAEAAFNALHDYAGPTGGYAEALLYDDRSALQVYYDETGGIGDIAARFRPWEGGIDLDAMLSYLLGAEPVDAGPSGKGLRLRPHLPDHQGSLEATGLRIGEATVTVRIEGDHHGRTVTVQADRDLDLWLELPVEAGAWPFHDGGGDVIVLPAGEVLVRFPVVSLQADRAHQASVSW